MTDNSDLFPFPPTPEDSSADNSAESALPAFPTSATELSVSSQVVEAPLTASELQTLRKMIEIFAKDEQSPKAEDPGETFSETVVTNQAVILPKPPVITAPVINPQEFLRAEVVQAFANIFCSDPNETEHKDIIKSIFNEITDHKTSLRMLVSLAGLFPLKKCIRHGTPEQRLFTIISLGDRFLESIAGLLFPERKKVIKAVARYLSQSSENYNFIQMEGEAFSSQYHERILGASSAGKIVREMHGFLVVGRDNNQVVRIGLVMT